MLKRYLAITVLLAGCASETPFTRPSPEIFTLGVTDQNKVAARYGDPQNKSSNILTVTEPQKPGQGDFDPVQAAGWYDHYSYRFTDSSGVKLLQGNKTRILDFQFFRDKLVGYDVLTTYEKEAIELDETRVATLVRGQSTQQDVIALLGAPTGRYIYPAIAKQNVEMLTYQQIALDKNGKYVAIKHLSILFGADGRVTDYRFDKPN